MSGASLSAREPAAAVFGCAGETLSTEEREFFRDLDPLGFILFQRNCASPDQVRALVDALRETVGRADAPVLIDQEGGRVARLRPPHWPRYPAPAAIASLGGEDASEAARLGAEPAQVAIAWVLAQSSKLGVPVVPIPGTKRVKWLEQNVASSSVQLDDEALAALDPLGDQVVGARY